MIVRKVESHTYNTGSGNRKKDIVPGVIRVSIGNSWRVKLNLQYKTVKKDSRFLSWTYWWIVLVVH